MRYRLGRCVSVVVALMCMVLFAVPAAAGKSNSARAKSTVSAARKGENARQESYRGTLRTIAKHDSRGLRRAVGAMGERLVLAKGREVNEHVLTTRALVLTGGGLRIDFKYYSRGWGTGGFSTSPFETQSFKVKKPTLLRTTLLGAPTFLNFERWGHVSPAEIDGAVKAWLDKHAPEGN